MEARLIKYEAEIIEGEILNLIKFEAFPLLERLLEDAVEYEAKAFYLKMKGDYLRYLVELGGKNKENLIEEAKAVYELATL